MTPTPEYEAYLSKQALLEARFGRQDAQDLIEAAMMLRQLPRDWQEWDWDKMLDYFERFALELTGER